MKGVIKMNIYTLKERLTGEKGKALNGKIFKVKKGETGSAAFVDINTGEIRWITTEVVNHNYTAHGIKLTTKNSTYELINVLNVLPSSTERK